MQNNNTDMSSNTSCNASIQQRRRINLIKKIIISIIILLIIIPTVMCIVLGVRVIKLESKFDKLLFQYQDILDSDMVETKDLAYAAVVPDDVNNDDTKESPGFLSGYDTYPQPIDGINIKDINPNNNNTDFSHDYDDNSDKVNDSMPDVDIKDNDPSDEKIEKDNSIVKHDGKYAGKRVYITFDDGPSTNTDEILDILAECNVKATFFVIGKTDSKSKSLYQRIVDEGHTLGMHSYSHKYDIIYNSIEDFDKDFTKLWELLYDTTKYKPTIYRFPGGSLNLESRNGKEDYINYLNDKNMVYYDWNVLNGDATGVDYTMEQLIDNVLSGVTTKKKSIVLMHDTQSKKDTVKSLPILLEELISEGAEILPLDESVSPIQQIKAASVE